MGSSQAWQERIYCLKNPSRLWKYVSAIYIPAARDYFNRLVGSSRLNNKHRQRVLATPARAFLLVYLVALAFDPCPLQDFSALLIWTWCCNVHVACTSVVKSECILHYGTKTRNLSSTQTSSSSPYSPWWSRRVMSFKAVIHFSNNGPRTMTSY